MFNNSQSEQMCQQELDEENFQASPILNIKSNDVAYMLIARKDLSTACIDLTGRFPMRSSRGNQYILNGCHYDENCIHSIAIKKRKSATLTATWQSLYDIFTKSSTAPNMYVMGIEISNESKEALQTNDTTYQLVPPHSHRHNLDERAIHIWKIIRKMVWQV